MTDDQIRDTMLGIEAFADKAEINIQDISTRLSKQLPIFAVYGDNAVSTFKRLELAAKSTGLSMETMLKTVENFDTFEGATKSVGSLNQMLGGPYLNAIELVQETDPVERMKMLKQAFDDAGLSVQDMSYYQKKAFVDMLPGIGNVTEMTELLEGNFDGLTGAMDATKKTANEIQAEAFAQMTPDEMMNEALEATLRLGNMLPQVTALSADNLSHMTESLEGLSKWGSIFLNELLETFDEPGEARLSGRVRAKGGEGAFLPEEFAKMSVDALTDILATLIEKIEKLIPTVPGVPGGQTSTSTGQGDHWGAVGRQIGEGFAERFERAIV